MQLAGRSNRAAVQRPFGDFGSLRRTHLETAASQAKSLRDLPLVTAHPNCLSVLKNYQVVTVEPWLNLFHELDIDNSRSMNSQEFLGSSLAPRLLRVSRISCVWRAVHTRA